MESSKDIEVWYWHRPAYINAFGRPGVYRVGGSVTDDIYQTTFSGLSMGDNRPYFCRSVMNHIFQDGECVFCKYREGG